MSLTQTNEIENHNKADPALKLYFLSHGTLESRDLAFSRRFYEKFLGLEVVQTSPISLLIRLGGNSTIAVVYSKRQRHMDLLNHNGLDVRTGAEVDEAHRTVCGQAEKWRLTNITKPCLQGSGANGTVDRLRWRAERAEGGNGQAEDGRGAVQGSSLRPRRRHPVRALVSSL